MYFGVDYHPEQWVYPYGGTPEKPEAAWERDIELMLTAGINVVRMGEFTWGLCERGEGKYDSGCRHRGRTRMDKAGSKAWLPRPRPPPRVWRTKNTPGTL